MASRERSSPQSRSSHRPGSVVARATSPTRAAETHELLWKLMCDYRPDDKATIQKDIVMHVEYTLARTRMNFKNQHAYQATAYSLRDRLVERFNDTHAHFADCKARMCYYISLEFLVGRSLKNAVCNLGLESVYAEALSELGYNLEALYGEEKDAALGNGGLGRLAACFMDSLAKENLPAWGYGLRYTYGMFEQKVHKGEQVEVPDNWLASGNPWEIERLDVQYAALLRRRESGRYPIGFYGEVEKTTTADGRPQSIWHPKNHVLAVAYDTLIPGYRTRNTINIRLWASRPAKEFDMESFNKGDYIGAVALRQESENITSVLYPNDNTYSGKELRLKQQYLLVSATLADIVRRFKRTQLPLTEFHTKVTIQLNDTHPALGIPELMRILVDLEGLEYEGAEFIAGDVAWQVVTATYNYTNHTVLPEALEKWPVNLLEALLPRHMQIIYDINHHFLLQVASKWPDNWDVLGEMSLIEEGYDKRVRMAHLAIVGSTFVNGVAALHTEIIKSRVFRKFHEMWPQKFQNKTNGVTPRRWLAQANPHLSKLVTETLSDDSWIGNLNLLSQLEAHADNPTLQTRWMEVKQRNKQRLSWHVEQQLGIQVDSSMMFDIHIKRIHEYKRQLLNVLGVIHRYRVLTALPDDELAKQVPRAVFFAGKAAPGYFMAKRVIKLIHNVAAVVNADDRLSKFLKVVFIPNYNVKLAEVMIPANDISQHISTAGTEASGTSNMKFAMNGGLIVGTLDGANVEIKEAVGEDQMFIFGLKTDEIEAARHSVVFSAHASKDAATVDTSASSPSAMWASVPDTDPRWIEVLRLLESPSQLFGTTADMQPILQSLTPAADRYCLAQDFASYLDAMDRAMQLYTDQGEWARRSVRGLVDSMTLSQILCTARMGRFSSDNTIVQYARELWKIEPCPLPVTE